MEVSGYFSLLAEDDLVSELEKLTKERMSKEEEGSLTDLRKKMMSFNLKLHLFITLYIRHVGSTSDQDKSLDKMTPNLDFET